MAYIDPLLFNAIQKCDISELMTYNDFNLFRPMLPILAQFISENHHDESIDWKITRKTLNVFLKPCKEISIIIDKLGIDFSKLAKKVKEQSDVRYMFTFRYIILFIISNNK